MKDTYPYSLLTAAMRLTMENEYIHIVSQYPVLSTLSIIALIIIAALLTVGLPTENSSIPLYVPEKSTVGSQKKRWMFDSPRLLQEAYKKVRGRLQRAPFISMTDPLYSSTASLSEFGRLKGYKLSFLQLMWMN